MLNSSVPLDSSVWNGIISDSQQLLGLARKIEYRKVDWPIVPMTSRILRPVVILPNGSDDWDDERKRMVLLHELAHIKRLDLPMQLLAVIACALYWFNPLAWYAIRNLRMQREQACDDCVVACGQRASDYADELVNLARTHQAPHYSVGVGMAQATNLERRLLALFDTARSHLPLSVSRSRTLWGILLLTVILVATVHPVQRVTANELEESSTTDVQKNNELSSKDSVETMQLAGYSGPIGQQPNGSWYVLTDSPMQLLVTDTDGQPIPKARILANVGSEDEAFKKEHTSLQKLVCDDSGRATVPMPVATRLIRIWVRSDGYVPLFIQWWPGKQKDGHLIPSHYEVSMSRGTEVGGTVVNEAGEPVEDASVEVRLNFGTENLNARPRYDHWLASGSAVRKTDASGRWSLNNVPAGNDVSISLKLTHADYVSDGLIQAEQKITLDQLRKKSARIVMHRGVVIRGKIADADGQPVRDAVVICGNDPYIDDSTLETRTDAEGKYQFPPVSGQKLNVTTIARGWMPQLIPVEVNPGMPPINFQLKPGKTIRLRIVDTNDQPLSGAWARVDRWRGIKSLCNIKHSNHIDQKIPLRANKEGIYEWTWAPDDEIQFEVSAIGHSEHKITVNPESADRTIVMQRVLVASGTVTNVVTGAAIEELTIRKNHYFPGKTAQVDPNEPIMGRDGRFTVEFDDNGLEIECEGYRTVRLGPWEVGEPNPELKVKLEPAVPLEAVVVNSSGFAVTKAEVFLATPHHEVEIQNHSGTYNGYRKFRRKVDGEGRFRFPAPFEDFRLIAFAEEGYAEVSGTAENYASVTRLTLQPWARVTGKVVDGGNPIADYRVSLSPIRPRHDGMPLISDQFSTTTNQDGTFEFNRVPPIPCAVSPWQSIWEETPIQTAESVPLNLRPGDNVTLNLSSSGRRVVGRIVLAGGEPEPVNLNYSLCYLVDRGAHLPTPASLTLQGFSHEKGWRHEFFSIPNDRRTYRNTLHHYFVKLLPDGSFTMPNVKPGNYDLVLSVYAPPEGRCVTNPIGMRIVPVIVAADERPLDLGEIPVDAIAVIKEGNRLPDVPVKTLAGESVSLSSFRGQRILISCWASWCGACRKSIPELRAIHALGKDTDIVLLGLSIDEDAETARKFVSELNLPWQQLRTGTGVVTRALGITSVPSYLLISPDGKVEKKSWQLRSVFDE